MRYFHQGRFRRRFREQFRFLRRQFLQDDALPFGDVLSESIVAKALTDNAVDWVDRISSPLVTLWVFLGQVLSANHSCRHAVARLIAHRLSEGQATRSIARGSEPWLASRVRGVFAPISGIMRRDVILRVAMTRDRGGLDTLACQILIHRSVRQAPIDTQCDTEWAARYRIAYQILECAIHRAANKKSPTSCEIGLCEVDRVGIETCAVSAGKREDSLLGGAESGAVRAAVDAIDPRLTDLVERWPSLPESVREAVVRPDRRR